ncbi:MAG: hypothetical protein JNM25_09515 [Planctomycetes bacterium]|nr:hypothetical protein [Planctomycetota bacterium]
MIKNNMGVGGIQLRVRGTLANGRATLVETGQQIPVTGGPERSTQPWLWFDALAFGLGEAEAATWLRETPAPSPGP